MKPFDILRGFLTTSAAIGLLVPQVALAASPSIKSPVTGAAVNQPALIARDVALQPGGRLQGQVFTTQGIPATGKEIAVGQNGKLLKSTRTDENGRFQFSGLSGGVYQVATDSGVGIYRLWAPQTAPPAAKSSALLVEDETVVRGGLGGGGIIGLLSNPWVLGGLTGAAIAIPLLLDDDDDQDAGS